MSDVVWSVIAAVLLISIFACAVYIAWQLFAPMKFRRVFVIYFESQSLRARASRWSTIHEHDKLHRACCRYHE